jgi:SOS response regulatory protein OraA/RecX
MPFVTALRERPRGRVEVELDGGPWRVVPADAVVRAGLRVGGRLDRETARTLGRELRRARALDVAARALRYRDHSRRSLEERLTRRDVRPDASEAALTALERAGLVDDARVASSRAGMLAERGYGDAAIRFELERQGLAGELVDGAVAALVPERDRARRLVERRGADPKTARWLAGRGFDAASVEDAIGSFAEDG